MNNIKLFFKGIIVGIGGIAPGLSGSVLMVILGLYTKVIDAIANLFKNFKKHMLLLIPIGIGIVIGIVLFSIIAKYLLNNYEVQTRIAFLGLLIGTIPLFYREVRKYKDVTKKHYLITAIAFLIGLSLLFIHGFNTDNGDLNIFQSFILGFVGISAMVIPGIDGAAFLSAIGLYGNWLEVTSLSSSLSVYIPTGLGVITGGFILSIIINKFIKKNYTMTFSILFGLFLSVIIGVLKMEDGSFITFNAINLINILLFLIGLSSAYLFGKLNKE